MTYRDPDYTKKYCEAHKEEKRAYDLEYRTKNSEKKKEYDRIYREKNREKINARSREYGRLHKEEVATRSKKWFEDNPERAKANRQEYQLRRKQIKLDKIIAEGGCCICGIKYDGSNAAIFDLHHLDPQNKVIEVGRCRGIKQATEELKKCSVVCSNCHRMLHFKGGD